MNALQETEFRILKCFVSVCDTLKLRYYLVCGSALGAVKYGGFIPWDDDIDVAMPRGDYEIFLEKAPQLLPEHLFIQNYLTDPAVPMIFTKLRDSNTTYIEASSAKLPINHGVYIDVFPLDGYPASGAEQFVLETKKQLYQKQLASAFDVKRGLRSQLHYRWFRLRNKHKHTAETAEKYTRMIRSYPIEGSALWCNHGNWQGKLEYAPREQYGEGARASFEGLTVRIPAQYDAYLTQKYGDWRADLPKEEQVGHHSYTTCDTTRPFSEYLNQQAS